MLAINPSPLAPASDSQIPQIRNASPLLPALTASSALISPCLCPAPPPALLAHAHNISPRRTWLSRPSPPRPAVTATPRLPSSPPRAPPRTRPPRPPPPPSTPPAPMTATLPATEAPEAHRHAQWQTSRAPPLPEKAAAGTRLSSPSLPSLPRLPCRCLPPPLLVSVLCSPPALRPRAARTHRTCRVRRKVSIIPQSFPTT